MNKINIKNIVKSVIATKMEALDLEKIATKAIEAKITTEFVFNEAEHAIIEYIENYDVEDYARECIDYSDVDDAINKEIDYHVSYFDYSSIVEDNLDYSEIADCIDDAVNEYLEDVDLEEITKECIEDEIGGFSEYVKECIKEVIEIE